jgi:hypothetical protein
MELTLQALRSPHGMVLRHRYKFTIYGMKMSDNVRSQKEGKKVT